jgi:hypothetical protein
MDVRSVEKMVGITQNTICPHITIVADLYTVVALNEDIVPDMHAVADVYLSPFMGSQDQITPKRTFLAYGDFAVNF